MNDKIKQIKKEMPLFIRLRMSIYADLVVNLGPPKSLEGAKGRYELWERSKKIADEIILTVKEWEADGRPGGL